MKTNHKKILSFTLLSTGLLIGMAGQGVLLFPWGSALDGFQPLPASTVSTTVGVFLYVLAGFLFILGLRRLRDGLPAFKVKLDVARPGKPGGGFWIVSLGLAGTIAMYATEAEVDNTGGYFFAGLWAFSIVLMIFGVLQEESRPFAVIETVRDWFKTHRAELVMLTAIVVAAFLIRFVDAELHPYSFNNDEGQMGSGGQCFLRAECANLFTLGWAAQPQPAFLAYAVSVGLLGNTALAVRLVSVITGALAILVVYLLAREIFNKKVAWLAAALLSTLPVHVHFSRMGVDNIIDSLTATLVLWLLFRGAKRGSRLSFLAAGVVAGLCIYTYPGSLLAPAFGVGALGVLALRTRGFLKAQFRNIVTFILAASVVATPILGYYATHSDFFLVRLKREGILQNGGLQNLIETTGQSAVAILAEQISKSSLVFIATDAPLNFFNSPKAYFPPIEAVFFMFGLAYVLWRIKDARCAVILGWFWMVLILGSALTASPPTSQRILMSMPAAAIITAIGMLKVIDAFTRFSQPVVKLAPGILLGFILLIGYMNINFYFYDYRVGHYYEDPKNELSYETHFYTAPLHTQGRLYLIANPRVPYLQYKSFDYFAPDVEKNTLNDITLDRLLKLPYDKDALFIALPDHKSDLALIARWIPGGQWHETKRRYQPQYTLFYSYKLTKEQLAVFTGFTGGYDKLEP